MSILAARFCTSDNAAVHPSLLRWSESLRRWYRRWRRREPIRSAGELRAFLQTRASHVAQMTLYGYLRTRAGTRFPELFENDPFIVSMNIAKWHVWLACLSDLAVYTGSLLRRSSGAPGEVVGAFMQRTVDEVLRETGTPQEAGPEYPAHAQRVRARLALCDWNIAGDGDAAFAESPTALVYWAPIVDDLKALDEEIVRNSMRFRWHEVRRELSHNLDPAAVLASAAPSSLDA
jgi:hypothetical protein